MKQDIVISTIQHKVLKCKGKVVSCFAYVAG